MHAQVANYRSKGFREVSTDSGTGSTVLVNDEERRAVKFNFDPAYDQFVSIVRSQPLRAFPSIYEHISGVLDSGPLTEQRYTITEMELLAPLSKDEQANVVSWIEGVYEACRSGTPFHAIDDDPFDLLQAIGLLISFAATNGVHLDLGKGTNYMSRSSSHSREIVITDPFNQ